LFGGSYGDVAKQHICVVGYAGQLEPQERRMSNITANKNPREVMAANEPFGEGTYFNKSEFRVYIETKKVFLSSHPCAEQLRKMAEITYGFFKYFG